MNALSSLLQLRPNASARSHSVVSRGTSAFRPKWGNAGLTRRQVWLGPH